MWTTVEMEVTRKRSIVSKSEKEEGKLRAPSCLQFAKCPSGISVSSAEGWTYDCRSPLTIVDRHINTHARLMRSFPAYAHLIGASPVTF